jgi:hypothetical protein
LTGRAWLTGGPWAALTSLAGLALLTRLALLARLPLLTRLTLLAGIREIPSCVLELRGRRRQVAVAVNRLVRVLEGLTEAIQRLLGSRGIALGDALDRIPERLPGSAACLAGGRLLFGQGRRHLATLLLCHAIKLLAETLEVLGRDFRVTVLVCVRLAGGGAGERPADRCERGCPLLVGWIELRPDALFDAAEAGQVELQVLGLGAELGSQVAQLLCQACPRIVRVRALGFEVLCDLVDAIRLVASLIANGLRPGDRGILGVREEDQRD